MPRKKVEGPDFSVDIMDIPDSTVNIRITPENALKLARAIINRLLVLDEGNHIKLVVWQDGRLMVGEERRGDR